jgi:hypothetical protein
MLLRVMYSQQRIALGLPRISSVFTPFDVLLYGCYPHPSPPRSQLEALLAAGGAWHVTTNKQDFIDSMEQSRINVSIFLCNSFGGIA